MGSSQRKDMEDQLLDLGRKMAPLIEALHQADRRLHNMMSIEFSSLASTMDELEPGFWSKYMAHRQDIFQEYMEERLSQRQNQANSKSPRETGSRRQSPFQSVASEREVGDSEASASPEETEERISLFSEVLDWELPPLKRYDRE